MLYVLAAKASLLLLSTVIFTLSHHSLSKCFKIFKLRPFQFQKFYSSISTSLCLSLIHFPYFIYLVKRNTRIMEVHIIFMMFRFQDWNSEKGSESNYPVINITHSGRFRTTLNTFSAKFLGGLESGSERIKRFSRSFKCFPCSSALSGSFSSRKKILDPQGPFLQKWNKIFVLLCVIAVSLDPLFFYVPVIDDEKKCLSLDNKMEITATVLRSFSDIFYIIHMFFQFRTGFIAPSSRVFGRGVLVEDSWAIAKRYLSSYFLIDILAVLPLPQAWKFLFNLLDSLIFIFSMPLYILGVYGA